MIGVRACTVVGGLALFASLAAGCGFFEPSVSVEQTGAAKVYAALNANALNDDELSAATREILHAHSLTELADDDPLAALRALHEATLRDPRRPGLFALSELAFHVGRQRDDRDSFLASAVYAWLYLFGTEDPVPANPYDRRFRWACDLYNTAVQRAFASPDGNQVTFEEQQRTLPVGSMQVSADWSAFPWPAADYPTLVPGDLYRIRGLSLRMRDSGLGVPLIGVPETVAEGRRKTPVAAFLRVSGGLADIGDGIAGTVELYSVFDAQTVRVDDAVVPLESDISVTLAYALHESPLWKFSLSGLFEGEQAVRENRLLMLRPYQAGRIPVVFVHGTASNPAYWAEMFNTLLGDPELRQRTQFWFFQYASGNPILYSALTLREQLQQTLASADPAGKDPALQQMILIGHSQGGLVVKLMAVDGSLDWFERVGGKKAEEFGFDEEQMQLIRRAFDFKALPCVSRVVFISTPHRGSYLADSWITRMVAKLIALPGEVQGLGDRLFRGATELPPELAGRVPTSLDNMNPNSPMIRNLIVTPIRAGVPSHSIVAIEDADEADPASLAACDDGVVAYSSAHIDGVNSELLVHASHSCQDNPLVIQEVRRILHEHLREH